MRSFIAPPTTDEVVPGPVPTFSVVISAYQVADFIEETVRSALEQTAPPLEVIVCDDGSTDGIGDVLEPFRDRITFIRQENRGPGAAKNAAAAVASGDFIALLDGDDIYHPGRLEALGTMAAARPDLDVLNADSLVEVRGKVVRRQYDETWAFDVDDQRSAILDRCFILGHAAVRRTRFVEVGGFDEDLVVDDWDFWVRVILGGSHAGHVPEPLSRYRVREESLSTRRVAICDACVRLLERAAERDDLSNKERVALERSLRSWRRDLALAEVRSELIEGGQAIRRKLLRIAIMPGVGFRTRLKLVVTAIAPRIVGRVAAARTRERWQGAAGVWLSSEQ